MPQRLPDKLEVVQEGTRFRVRSVPIFAECTRALPGVGEVPFSREWLHRAASDTNLRASRNYHAPVHLVHHGRVSSPEPVGEVAGNAYVDEAEVQVGDEPDFKARPVLFADVWLPDAEALRKFERYPHRSVEVNDVFAAPRINTVALLGAQEPFVKFPNARLDRPRSVFFEAAAPRRVAALWIGSTSQGGLMDVKQLAEPAAVTPPVEAQFESTPAQAVVERSSVKAENEQQSEVVSLLQRILAKLESAPQAAAPSAAPAATVQPVVMERTVPGVPVDPAIEGKVARLEAENAVLLDKAAIAERRLGVADTIAKLEAEGFPVGAKARALFESVATKGGSLEDIVKAIKLHAPSLPRSSQEAAAVAMEQTDPPEVVAYGPPGSEGRKKAREVAVQFELIHKNGGDPFTKYPMTLQKFLKSNVGPASPAKE